MTLAFGLESKGNTPYLQLLPEVIAKGVARLEVLPVRVEVDAEEVGQAAFVLEIQAWDSI